MTENKNKTYTGKDFLTLAEFKKKHHIPKEYADVIKAAADWAYKRQIMVKNPAGHDIPAVRRNEKSHNGKSSPYKIAPMAHDVLLEKMNKLIAKTAKEAEK